MLMTFGVEEAAGGREGKDDGVLVPDPPVV
jgi:hypothetical protein